MLQIRKAGNNDAALIASLSRQTFYDTFHEQNLEEDMAMYLDENFNDTAILLEISDPDNSILIVEEEEVPVAYAKLSINNKQFNRPAYNCIEIGRIYCTQQVIGKGVGKFLMQECITLAESIGMDCIWLGVWEHNSRAIEFYKKFGFKKFDEHVFMLGNDLQNDWLMKKNLGNHYEN
jgi:GNAT superfamily N-acetyltransferase